MTSAAITAAGYQRGLGATAVSAVRTSSTADTAVAHSSRPLTLGPSDVSKSLTYHDPCYLARVNGVTAAPRELIDLTLPGSQDNRIIEAPRHGRETACCGAGGGRMWFDDGPESRVGAERIRELLKTGAETIAVACPFCLTMVADGIAAENSQAQIKDVAELLLAMLSDDESSRPTQQPDSANRTNG